MAALRGMQVFQPSPCLLSAPGCHMVSSLEDSPGGSRHGRPPVIFNPDFFVEKLRHESPDVFLEMVLSNISRLIDLPGAEFSQLLGDDGPKTPTGGSGGFFRSFNFLKRKGGKLCVCVCVRPPTLCLDAVETSTFITPPSTPTLCPLR